MNFKTEVEAANALQADYQKLTAEIRKKIYGQDDIIKKVLISIFSNGHCLLVGVPGLAKTLLVNTIAQVLDLKYQRIQFTPDLMPSDIIGTEILNNERKFNFILWSIKSSFIIWIGTLIKIKFSICIIQSYIEIVKYSTCNPYTSSI